MASSEGSAGNEPQARQRHAAAVYGRYMLLWGGTSGKEATETSAVEIFDVMNARWLGGRRLGKMFLPDGLRNMAVAWDKEKAYTFGGIYGKETRINDVYEVHLASLACRKVAPASDTASASPQGRTSSAIVLFGRKLISYGGYTVEHSNELYAFDLDKRTWTAQHTTGDRPPPRSGHTFTLIDAHRALMFGGYGEGSYHNDTYQLDLNSWTWTKVKTHGRKPSARRYHAACAIGNAGQAALLMVIGGWDGKTAFSDVWVLNVSGGSWRKMTLPAKIKGRRGHSAVVVGIGPDFRVVVLFGGSTSSYVGDEIAKTTLLLLSRKVDWWVVSRVVGPKGLLNAAQDIELKQQLGRLELPEISGQEDAGTHQPMNIPQIVPYHHYDDKFPGVRFLGLPQEVSVQSKEAVTVSPPGLGVSLTVPAGALQSDSGVPANVTLKTCLPTPSFTFPEGYAPFSAVYHLSAISSLKKEVHLTFEHFARVDNEEEANEIVVFRAKSSPTVGTNGRSTFVFSIANGDSAIGEGHCTVSTKQSGFVSAGALRNSGLCTRFAVLCSYTNNIQDIGHAAVAVSVDDEVYINNFRNALQQEWETSLSHRSWANVFFSGQDTCVEFPPSFNGWNIVCMNSSQCTLSLEDVDVSNPSAKSLYDYPPRLFFDIIPTEGAKPCTLQLCLSGLSKAVDFKFSLRQAKASVTKPNVKGQMGTERPTLVTLGMLMTHDGGEIRVIEESANHYHRIGPILLNDRYGERVETIESDERGKGERIIMEIYKKWMREDVNCSWTALAECFRECHLYRLAHNIEQHFGIPSPPLPQPATTAQEENSVEESAVHPRQPPKKGQLIRKYKLTEYMLLQKCSQDHMLEIMGFISWRDVGPRLPGIDRKVDLSDIQKDGHDEADKRRRLVSLWEERNGDDATYDVMLTAMVRAGKVDEATKVCQLLNTESGISGQDLEGISGGDENETQRLLDKNRNQVTVAADSSAEGDQFCCCCLLL